MPQPVETIVRQYQCLLLGLRSRQLSFRVHDRLVVETDQRRTSVPAGLEDP